MSGWLFVVPIIFAVMNAVGFALMGADKSRAENGAFRIPERTLIAVAFMLGGVGSLAGMFAFRHKTRHVKFVVLLPVAALFSVAAAAAAEYLVWTACA